MSKSRTELTERDMNLIRALYELRVLSAKQIKRGYYQDYWYGYRRARQLKAMGYLDSSPLTNGRRKETQYYYLTGMGIKLLGLVKPRESSKNRIRERFMVARQLQINEIIITIQQLERENGSGHVWEWMDSRKVKEDFKFNRRNLIAGMLKNITSGDKYGIFIPTNAEKMETICEGISKEINKHDNVRSNIVLCSDISEEKQILRYYNDNLKPVGNDLRVLPYPAGIDIIYNTLTNHKSYLLNLFSSVFNVAIEQLKPTPSLHAGYECDDFYYTEMLTNDIVQRYHIGRYIKDIKYTKPVKIVCWSFQVPELEKMYYKSLKKIILAPRDWTTDQIIQGLSGEAFTSDMCLKKTKNVTVTLYMPSDVAAFLKIITLNNNADKTLNQHQHRKTKSEFVTNLVTCSDDYKNYLSQKENSINDE